MKTFSKILLVSTAVLALLSCSKEDLLDDESAELNFEYVDLGLSVKWATCNFGASKPEDYGHHRASSIKFDSGGISQDKDYRFNTRSIRPVCHHPAQ